MPDIPDDREPKPCPRCGVMCTYDGWDHVHPNGVGIGSCQVRQDAGPFEIAETRKYTVRSNTTGRVMRVTDDYAEAVAFMTELNNLFRGDKGHTHLWEQHSAHDGDYRKCGVCGQVEDL